MKAATRWTALLTVTCLAGCVTPPSRISPEHIDPAVYAGQSCEELQAEYARVEADLNAYSSRQKYAMAGDFISDIFLGLPLATTVGDDHWRMIHNLKGKVLAIESAAGKAGCTLQHATFVAEKVSRPTSGPR